MSSTETRCLISAVTTWHLQRRHQQICLLTIGTWDQKRTWSTSLLCPLCWLTPMVCPSLASTVANKFSKSKEKFKIRLAWLSRKNSPMTWSLLTMWWQMLYLILVTCIRTWLTTRSLTRKILITGHTLAPTPVISWCVSGTARVSALSSNSTLSTPATQLTPMSLVLLDCKMFKLIFG